MSDAAHIIWNTNAGSAAQQELLAGRLDNERGVRVFQSHSREEAVELARRAMELGVPRIVAAGGDGTVNAIASEIVRSESQSALGILPLGTGNDLARSLGMPLDPEEALYFVLDGSIERIDVIEARSGVQNRIVFNMSTAGNSGRFADSVSDEIKQQWGALAYLRAAVAALRDLTVHRIVVEADDAPPVTLDALNVFVANGRTSGGGFRVAPAASLNDGYLDYMIALDGTASRLTKVAADYAFDRLLENELIVWGRAKSLRLSSTPVLSFSADGEAIDETIDEFRVRPRALPVVVGPEFAGELRKVDADSESLVLPAAPLGVV
jgi:diacylglycerol kinase (ATP)